MRNHESYLNTNGPPFCSKTGLRDQDKLETLFHNGQTWCLGCSEGTGVVKRECDLYILQFFLGFKSLAFQIGIKLMFCIYMQHNGWWSNCFVELCMWMGHPLWNRLRKIRKPINYVIAVRHGLGWFLLWIAHIWVSIYWQTALCSGSCFGQTWRITKTELRLTI